MGKDITVEPVEDLPAESRICHYDELDGSAKARLPELVECDDPSVTDRVADGFGDCDVVKFTDYYEVSIR